MTVSISNGKGLLKAALDESRKPKDRWAALMGANDCRSKAKVGWAKLGAPEGFNMAAFSDDLKKLLDADKTAKGESNAKPAKEPAKAEKPKKEKAEKKAADPNRGAIGRLVNELLVDTDLDYAAIEARVRKEHPDAKTTRRSIASVAADLRRVGVDVKTRRKAAAAK